MFSYRLCFFLPRVRSESSQTGDNVPLGLSLPPQVSSQLGSALAYAAEMFKVEHIEREIMESDVEI